MMEDEDPTVLVDASVFITLAAVGRVGLLQSLDGIIVMPKAVVDEIQDEPARSQLTTALNDWLGIDTVIVSESLNKEYRDACLQAASHLGINDESEWQGDVALLALAIHEHAILEVEPVVITDDKPLRKTCKALGFEKSGSIGVVIAAVERGIVEPNEAKRLLTAMDEVGARLSARLLRRAERLIDEAADRDE